MSLLPSADISVCDREPIHILGRIQSHGLLMVLSEPDLTVTQVSSNAPQLIGRAVDTVLGQPIDALMDETHVKALRTAIITEPIDENAIYISTMTLNGTSAAFDGIVHRTGGALILELEPTTHAASQRHDVAMVVRNSVVRLQRSGAFADFCQAAVVEVRNLTGFDRVMLYKFDRDGHGSVVAEACDAERDSFLGLHYPASDIPPQARALYLRNWLRLIGDVADVAAVLVPPLNPASGAPLDLSFTTLRSVSPIHIEYLQNMHVKASMSLSVVVDGQLWGLLACHHYQGSRLLSFELRSACEFLAQAVSLQIEGRQRSESLRYSEQVLALIPTIAAHANEAETWQEGIASGSPQLYEIIRSGGSALCTSTSYMLQGITPPESRLRQLVKWLATNHGGKELYSTDRLGSVFPDFADQQGVASGLLALALVPDAHEYILWFRPEEEREVQWAGEPTKAVSVDEQGVRVSPRKSFAIWKERVRGRAVAWHPAEEHAALTLKQVIVNLIVRRAEELARLNSNLERSNTELDAFAFIASHDLREPLRGIFNFAHFLLEDYGDRIDSEGHTQVQTIIRLVKRMDTLLESLLQYSRVGRLDLTRQPIDVNVLLTEVLDTLTGRFQEQQARIHIARALPTVHADAIRLNEVFTNLIVNGVKYNSSSEKLIEIGWLAPDELTQDQMPPGAQALRGPILYVRDNGIGIAERHYDQIFRIFRRLHGREEYGGGSGAGLTIARKIIERHNGLIWVSSQIGEGTTFYFTLQGE